MSQIGANSIKIFIRARMQLQSIRSTTGVGKTKSTLLLLPFAFCAELPVCELPPKGKAMANRGNNWVRAASVYEFSYVDIDGNIESMEKYRGKVLIIINVASQCDLSDVNFTQLVALHEKYGKSNDLSILAFPSNEFGRQEPWDEPDIKEHLKTKYKVNFDLASKVEVNGQRAHPLFKFLKRKEPGCWWFLTSRISWNFNKFLIDRDGHVFKRYTPHQTPYEILPDICENYWFDPPKCPSHRP